jgi:hypothetical protein
MIGAGEGGLGRRELVTIGGLWLLLVLAYCAVNAAAIGAMRLPDADDYLRLQQVRDWLAGQAWFDVSQHRINPPHGGLLHWSRVVDLPLAFVIVVTRPFVGQAQAEMMAAVAVPMAVMGLIMLLVGAIAARTAGRAWAPVAAFAAPLSGLIYTQIMPLRVDHHGWQIVAALTMLWALMDEARPRRSGIIAGVAAAFWLNISIEGLPITACVGALLGVRWVMDGEAKRLQAFVWSLAAAVAILETATIANTWVLAECDRLSRPYEIALVIASAGAALASVNMFSRGWRRRMALGAAIVVVAGASFALKAPQCLAGPFGALEPLTKAIWFDNVEESKALWQLGIGAFIAHGGFVLVGCVGAVLALRAAKDAVQRWRWITVLVLCVAASVLMLVLLRTGAVAHAYAAAGAAFAARALFVRARAASGVLPRVFGTVAALLLALPVPWLPAMSLNHRTLGAQSACSANVGALTALPAGVIFAPLDVSPQIVARTPHSVVATGHHRNHAAMSDVISAFTGGDAAARAQVQAHHADYVAICADAPEAGLFVRYAPQGFAANLLDGRAPAWLEPLNYTDGQPSLRLYRVRN